MRRPFHLVLAIAIAGPLDGCALVFGISGGEYDPDPFGTRDSSSETRDSDTNDAATSDADTGDAATSDPDASDSAASDSGAGDAVGGDSGASDAARSDSGASEPTIDSGIANDAPAGDAAGNTTADAAPVDAGAPPCGLLLDDLESGDGKISRCAGRNGRWYTANDGLPGTQVPAPTDEFLPVQPGHNSKYCAHTSGNGFTSGGAQMGFSFAIGATGARIQYDLSAYTGITFWAKSATSFTMYVNLPDRNTDPAGGVCKPSGIVCNDTYGKGVAVGTTWSQINVPFSILNTDGAGAPGGFDRAHVYAIEFHAAPTEMPFEFWVDDIALYK